MKHKGLIVAIISLAIFGLVINFFFDTAIQNADPYAQYSLLIQAIFAAMLALYFWHLQKIDNDKMQEILDATNKMIKENRDRETIRKQFWVNVADSSLFILRSDLRNLHAYYDIILNKSPNEQRLDEIEQLIKLDRSRAIRQTAPTLNMAMSQIANLLDDNSLFRDVNSADFAWLLETADVRQPAQKIQTAMTMIEVTEENIDTLRERLKKEMPAGL